MPAKYAEDAKFWTPSFEGVTLTSLSFPRKRESRTLPKPDEASRQREVLDPFFRRGDIDFIVIPA